MTIEAGSTFHTLRLLLGDQLDINHSWFAQSDPGVLYLVAELGQEAGYVRHHVQKLCAFFAAMQRFAHALESSGHAVLHLTLDDTQQYEGLEDLLSSLCQRHGVARFEFPVAGRIPPAPPAA